MKKTFTIVLTIIIIVGAVYLAYTRPYRHTAVQDSQMTGDMAGDQNPASQALDSGADTTDSTTKEPIKSSDSNPLTNMGQQPTTKVEYMCADKVKIVTEQDSPSLPPRVSYIRASDGATVAYYGDFGAFIYPDYFSIDRSQIERGYEFDEANFCKYLKS